MTRWPAPVRAGSLSSIPYPELKSYSIGLEDSVTTVEELSSGVEVAGTGAHRLRSSSSHPEGRPDQHLCGAKHPLRPEDSG